MGEAENTLKHFTNISFSLFESWFDPKNNVTQLEWVHNKLEGKGGGEGRSLHIMNMFEQGVDKLGNYKRSNLQGKL